MSRKVAGRALEKEKLSAALASHRSELIAIYGRRRIGKTYLIREYYSKHIIFSFSGLRGGSRPEQLENFMIQLGQAAGKDHGNQAENWLQAFTLLKQHLQSIRKTKRKKVLFIAEIPWVDPMRSGFLPAFAWRFLSDCNREDMFSERSSARV